MSPRAELAPGKAIRGGIPVIFPQFAQRGSGFRHGFARLRQWRLADCAMPDPARTTLVLSDSEESRESWPHRFHAELQVALAGGQLSTSLQVTNTDTLEFVFTAALHTYFRVEDIGRASLSGLEGRHYLDCVGQGASRSQGSHPLRFSGEIDRIYPNASGPCVLDDGLGSVRIEARGFADTVVWNPGPQLAAATHDLGPGQHVHFVCVEAATVETPIRLGPGETWKGSQTLVTLDS